MASNDPEARDYVETLEEYLLRFAEFARCCKCERVAHTSQMWLAGPTRALACWRHPRPVWHVAYMGDNRYGPYTKEADAREKLTMLCDKLLIPHDVWTVVHSQDILPAPTLRGKPRVRDGHGPGGSGGSGGSGSSANASRRRPGAPRE